MKFIVNQVLPCKGKHFMTFVMRTAIFLFCSTLLGFMPKEVTSQNTKIKINTDQVVTVDEVFDIIKAQTDYRFVYEEGIFKDLPKVHLEKGTVRTFKLLRESLSQGDYTIIVTANNGILIKEISRANKRLQRQVSGQVTDENGVPLAGVTVLIKGTTKGVVTDFDGRFAITVPDPAHVLMFSSLGYEAQEILVGNKTTINVTLKESVSQLDEVVVNAGYYNVSQREKTGSISSIKAGTIEKQPVNSPLGAMVGQMPGVNITQDSGVPGSGFNVEIRGRNFLNGSSSPLYVIDGVPYGVQVVEDQIGFAVIPQNRFLEISPINSIDPANIESIEVLKDADATAIYGSRGANGVVLITTKKGKKGKTQVNITASTTLGHAIPVDLMNTEQYLEMRLEALTNDGFTLETVPQNFRDSAHDLYRWDQDRYTDWQEVLLGNTSYRQNVQLTLSGGREQTQFLLSGGYQQETTVFPGDSDYGRASLSSTIDHTSNDGRFRLTVSTNYIREDNQLPSVDFTSTAFRLPPNAPELLDEEGNLNWEENGGNWLNPLARLENKFRSQNSTLLLNTVMTYELFTNTEFTTNLGYNTYNSDQYNIFLNTSRPPSPLNTSERSIHSSSILSRQSWIVEPQVNWRKQCGKAGFNVLVGATFQQEQFNQLRQVGSNFTSNSQVFDLSAAASQNILLDEESDYKYHAIFGRINLNWEGRYILNLTGRWDGSSRFGPGRQFGNFGAVGMAWLFSEEQFLNNSTILSFGKLRSSYGITGSDGIPNYGFFDTYESPSIGGAYDGAVLQATGLFNPNFSWEENRKFEAAMELGFFRDRIFITAAWYRNRSTNQLTGIPLPGTTGFSTINANFDALVQNSGLEIDFRSTNMNKNHVNWTTRFNLTIPKNELVRFDGLEGSTFRNSLVVGESLDIIKLYHNLGVDSETGVYQFEDYNNDGLLDVDDRQFLVDRSPTFFGALGNTITYKNWSLDFLMNFKKQISTGDLFLIPFAPGASINNQHISALDRWQQVGDIAPVQRYSFFDPGVRRASELDLASSRRYINTSFVRLKNISLTYNLAKDLTPGFNASIYLQGQDLFYLYRTKNASNPEQLLVGAVLPSLRQFTLGFQIGF